MKTTLLERVNNKRHYTRKELLQDIQKQLSSITGNTVIQSRNTFYIVEESKTYKVITKEISICNYKLVDIEGTD